MAQRYSADNAKEITNQYATLLREHIKLEKVILYGSFVKGQPHMDSDIDVAVVSPDFTGDRLEDQLKLMRFRRQVDLRIEPIPFLPEDFIPADPLAKEIMDTGYVIYSG
ncbi:MAG: nucleotidyltransferase domain-containing protein [Limnochordia bacterium]|nr:nucleotidyltransferase domain-containing protein [Limnochordia bacterium]HZK18708.1 nucleotidyltransferase domain-containing protein [Clostridia bacterium]